MIVLRMSKAAIAGYLLLASAVAIAAHPLATDDTGTQGIGNHQIEFSTDRARIREGVSRVASFTYSYGVHDNLDVFSTLPFSLREPEGRGDASVGMKWRAFEEQDTSVALKPEFFLPTGAEEKALGTGRASAALTLIATQETGRWTIHGNAGFALNRFRLNSDRRENRRHTWRTSVAAGYEISRELSAVGEIGMARNISRSARRDPAFVLLGLIYSPAENLDLDIGLRRGLNAAEARQQIGAGLAFRF